MLENDQNLLWQGWKNLKKTETAERFKSSWSKKPRMEQGVANLDGRVVRLKYKR